MSSILINELRAFDFRLEYGKLKGIKIIDLLNEEKCTAFLHKQMSEIKAPNLTGILALVGKQISDRCGMSVRLKKFKVFDNISN